MVARVPRLRVPALAVVSHDKTRVLGFWGVEEEVPTHAFDSERLRAASNVEILFFICMNDPYSLYFYYNKFSYR